MTSYITDTQRFTARDEAVTAARAWFAGTGEGNDAARAVTAAIVIYGISHRQLAQLVGVTGVAIIRLIDPGYQYPQLPSADRRVLAARAEALRVERVAVNRYQDEVMAVIRAETLHRIDIGDDEAPVARDLGINRTSLRNWVGKGAK